MIASGRDNYIAKLIDITAELFYQYGRGLESPGNCCAPTEANQDTTIPWGTVKQFSGGVMQCNDIALVQHLFSGWLVAFYCDDILLSNWPDQVYFVLKSYRSLAW